jgi:hypothetical protein
MTIDIVVVSMTLKIENNNYSKTPPEVAVLKRPLGDESLARKYLTLSFEFLTGHIN